MPCLSLSPERAAVRVWGQERRLTPLDYKLLDYLLTRAGHLVTRDDLLVEVWGYQAGLNTRAVDNTLRRLRQKLGTEQGWALNTVYGGGYLLELEPVFPLPSRTGSFLGRETLLETVTGLCGEEGALVTLTGPGGTGKTRLALELAWTLPEPPLWVELAPVGTGGLRKSIAAAFGVSVHALEGAWTEFSGLLVVDNGEHLVPELVAFLREQGRQRVLLTSRVPLELPREKRIPVPPFSPSQALSFYRAQVARHGQALPLDSQALTRSLDAVDRLPLAVAVLASLAPMLPIDDASGTLEVLPLLVSTELGSPHNTLESVVAWSWSLLTADQQDHLCRLSGFGGRFSLSSAAAVLGLSSPQTASCLAALAKASLLDLGPMDARLYQAAREFARSHESEEQRAAFLSWALGLATSMLWVTPFGPDWEGIRAEMPDLQRAMALTEDPSQQLSLALVSARWLWRGAPLMPLIRQLEDRIASAAGQQGAPLDHAAMLLATLCLNAGQPDRAQGWLAALKDKSESTQGRGLSILGSALRMKGEIDAAREALNQAIVLLEGRDDYEHFRALCRLAALEEFTSGPKTAEPILWRAVQAAEELDNPYAQCMISAQIGSNLSIQGRCQEAASVLNQAIQSDPNAPTAGALYLNLAIAQLGLGELAEAEVALRRAERFARRRGDRANQAMALNNLGTLLMLQENPKDAERSLKMAQAARPGLHRAGAMAQGNLGILALLFGDIEQALARLEGALPDCGELGLHQANACYSTFATLAVHLLGRTQEAQQRLVELPRPEEPEIQRLQSQVKLWLDGGAPWPSLQTGDGEDLRLLHLMRKLRSS